MCKEEIRILLTGSEPNPGAQLGASRPGPANTHFSDGEGRSENQVESVLKSALLIFALHSSKDFNENHET